MLNSPLKYDNTHSSAAKTISTKIIQAEYKTVSVISSYHRRIAVDKSSSAQLVVPSVFYHKIDLLGKVMRAKCILYSFTPFSQGALSMVKYVGIVIQKHIDNCWLLYPAIVSTQ